MKRFDLTDNFDNTLMLLMQGQASRWPLPAVAVDQGEGPPRGPDWLYLSGPAPSEPNNPWPITLKASHLPFSLFLG